MPKHEFTGDPGKMNWDKFPAGEYGDYYYGKLSDADRRIIQKGGRWLLDHVDADSLPSLLSAGEGANGYGSSLWAPFARSITLSDISQSVLAHIQDQLNDPAWPEHNAEFEAAMVDIDPLWNGAFGKRQKLGLARQLDVLNLPPDEQWGAGLMLTVAESLTNDPLQFERAVDNFISAVEPGGPVMATFMAGSRGYTFGGVTWPALPVYVPEIRAALGSKFEGTVEPVGGAPVRPGDKGMVLALGHRV